MQRQSGWPHEVQPQKGLSGRRHWVEQLPKLQPPMARVEQ
jgi:hypothetical protein